jgi:aconitate hydratase
MQDATAQMALLQFMQAGRPKVAVPSTVHCDHLITAKDGSKTDLAAATSGNKEVYDFLASVSNKYGHWFLETGCRYYSPDCVRELCFPRWNDDWNR